MLYFAYGSNMDPGQMARRCPGSVSLGRALLRGHRLGFTYDSERWAGGVGTVFEDPGSHVWGVLWEIDADDERSLDAYEGIADGIYRRDAVTVEHGERVVDALIYIATDTAFVHPSPRYLHALIRGARAADIPEGYVDSLVSMLPEMA